MRLSDFDYDLPEDLIALRPARPRRAARMLVVDGPALSDAVMSDLPAHLRPNDILVFNNTKVIPAQLSGARRRGDAVAHIDATLIERLSPDRWRALARPGKRLALDDVIDFNALTARVAAKEEGGAVVLAFDVAGLELDAALAAAGAPPLPPYIARRRAADAQDKDDYQTVFAKHAGAVAAPTASLHFDEVLLEALRDAGVRSTEVTLHVGAGTFLPVATDDPSKHKMHAEMGEIGAEAIGDIEAARAAGGRVVAVGTTALRVLETAAAAEGRLRPWAGATDLFVTPGFRFRATDALITNFHLPKTTLMLLVAAFVGPERIMRAYAHAVAAKYRFYSYGDGSLLFRDA